jgi:hypothetical protein
MSDDFDDIDWTDPEEVRRFLVGLRVHLDDIDGVVKDMLARPRKRELGPKQHRRIYEDAREGVVAAIEHAMPKKAGPVQ